MFPDRANHIGTGDGERCRCIGRLAATGRRVAGSRAIAGKPAVLLADEPTGSLDTSNGELVMELLAELHAAGSTLVMVTHDRRFNRYASRTIELLDGALFDGGALAV